MKNKKIYILLTGLVCIGFLSLSVLNVMSLFSSKGTDIDLNTNSNLQIEKESEPLVIPEIKPVIDTGYDVNKVVEDVVTVKKHNYKVSISNIEKFNTVISEEGNHLKTILADVYSQLYGYMKSDLSLEVKESSLSRIDNTVTFTLIDSVSHKEILSGEYFVDAEMLGQLNIH